MSRTTPALDVALSVDRKERFSCKQLKVGPQQVLYLSLIDLWAATQLAKLREVVYVMYLKQRHYGANGSRRARAAPRVGARDRCGPNEKCSQCPAR